MKEPFEYDEIIRVAHEVCDEIENLDIHNPSKLLSLLINLLGFAHELDKHQMQVEDEEICIPSGNAETLTRIPDNIIFHELFDPLDAKSVCEVSLKDSLADIYDALKGGLIILNREPPKKLSVLWEWRNNFRFHWGRHLVDVIRFFTICRDVDLSGKNANQ